MGAIFGPFLDVIALIVDIYFKIVLIEVVLHWLIHFGILDTTNKYAKKTMEILEKLTQPVYNKIKEKVPAVVVSNIDFSPFVLLIGLFFIGRVVYRLNLMLM